MEPTLLIGDELLATKYPYGYGTASLPSFIVLPNTQRMFGALPRRGDVVVFRWPGDRSQIWVKRVIGLPGDRIALRDGQVWINGEAAALQPDGTGQAENDDGTLVPAARLIETLPGGRKHTIFKLTRWQPLDNMRGDGRCRPAICSSWATTATIPPTAACRCAPAASACCRWRTWSAASTASSAPGTSACAAGRSGPGRRACGCRGFSPACSERGAGAQYSISAGGTGHDFTFSHLPFRQANSATS